MNSIAFGADSDKIVISLRLLIKRLRHVESGLFTSLFFTPVALLVLSLLMVFITGTIF
ncbi:MAG TPA: hypothetical protein VNE38_20575 [Ktedonobacteraceae bacterium]|nr:hypothetical protein [Ktedonobacteraceae bacterium]